MYFSTPIPDLTISDIKKRRNESPYDVLVLHRESDNKAVIRLRGFDNLVFWKEINLNKPNAWIKVQKAKTKAENKSYKLRNRDENAKRIYQGATR